MRWRIIIQVQDHYFPWMCASGLLIYLFVCHMSLLSMGNWCINVMSQSESRLESWVDMECACWGTWASGDCQCHACVTSYIPCSGDSLARLETKHEMHLNCSNADFGTCPKHSCALSRMPMHDSCQTMQLTWSWPVLRLIWCTHAHMCIEFCSSSRICSMYVAWTTSTNNVQATSNALLKECFFVLKYIFFLLCL